MPVPNPRNSIRPARGNYVDLAGNVSSLEEGEICYAIDQDKIYMIENGALVPIGASLANATLGGIGDVNLINALDGDALIYNGGQWRNGGNMDGGSF